MSVITARIVPDRGVGDFLLTNCWKITFQAVQWLSANRQLRQDASQTVLQVSRTEYIYALETFLLNFFAIGISFERTQTRELNMIVSRNLSETATKLTCHFGQSKRLIRHLNAKLRFYADFSYFPSYKMVSA